MAVAKSRSFRPSKYPGPSSLFRSFPKFVHHTPTFDKLRPPQICLALRYIWWYHVTIFRFSSLCSLLAPVHIHSNTQSVPALALTESTHCKKKLHLVKVVTNLQRKHSWKVMSPENRYLRKDDLTNSICSKRYQHGMRRPLSLVSRRGLPPLLACFSFVPPRIPYGPYALTFLSAYIRYPMSSINRV